jgi:basic membrane protein A and related proteins
MKHLTRLALLLAVGALLTACNSPAPQPPEPIASSTPAPTALPTNTPGPTATPDPMAALEGRKLAAVFSGSVGDAGWTESAYAALSELRTRYGIEIAYTENVALDAGETLLRGYAESGYDYVLAHGGEWDQAMGAVAAQFPNTRFIQTNGSEGALPNLYTVSFSTGEGGYFVGMIACLTSRTGKAGYVAGSTFPVLDHQIEMSRQACKDLGKNVEFVESYIGNWHDSVRAKELARAAIENGTDVLILQAEAADSGTIEAASEARVAGQAVLLISWPRDKHELAPEQIIGGWDERVPRLIEYALERITREEPGGHFALGLRENAAGLNPFYGLVPAEVEKLVAGTLERYRADPTSIPALVVRTDL